jgi:hypothetical protein
MEKRKPALHIEIECARRRRGHQLSDYRPGGGGILPADSTGASFFSPPFFPDGPAELDGFELVAAFPLQPTTTPTARSKAREAIVRRIIDASS